MTATRPRGSLWRRPEFMKLWTAETVSQLGTQVTALALPLVAITVLQSSPFEVALLGTIEYLPFILISLPAGVWVDRMRRRPILIVGDLGRALALASIPIAYVAGVLTIYQLYAVGFVTGVLTVFFDVAYQAYLPALVERDELVEGNSKLDISRSGAQLFGPGLAGGLIQFLSAPIAIVVDSISFLGSALFLFLIRRRESPPEAHPVGRPGPGMRTQVAEGLRYVLGHRYLRNIAACTGTSNFFSNVIYSILLVYAVRELGMGPGVIGLIFSIGAVGFLAGAVVANRVASLLGVGRTILFSAITFGIAPLFFAVAPRPNPEPFFILSVLLGGFAGVIYNVNQVSLRQAITPDRMQGRMNATMRFIVWGTIPIGSLVGGAIATAFGLGAAIWVGALGSLTAFLPILLSAVPTIERMPEPPDEPGAPPPVATEPQRA